MGRLACAGRSTRRKSPCFNVSAEDKSRFTAPNKNTEEANNKLPLLVLIGENGSWKRKEGSGEKS